VIQVLFTFLNINIHFIRRRIAGNKTSAAQLMAYRK